MPATLVRRAAEGAFVVVRGRISRKIFRANKTYAGTLAQDILTSFEVPCSHFKRGYRVYQRRKKASFSVS